MKDIINNEFTTQCYEKILLDRFLKQYEITLKEEIDKMITNYCSTVFGTELKMYVEKWRL